MLLGRGQKEFLYNQLGVDAGKFRQRFNITEEDLWEMLAYVHGRYEEFKNRNMNESEQYRQEENSKVIRYASWQIVSANIAEEKYRRRVQSAICRIMGHAGGNAAYRAWLQPTLSFSS